MRQQRSGHILNISSEAGFVFCAGAAIYCSTKFALEGMDEALAKEVAPLGIKVIIIEPGSFRTDFVTRSLVVCDTLPDYEATINAKLQSVKAELDAWKEISMSTAFDSLVVDKTEVPSA